jgi:L-threonylcarbamoyladenylate synthase
MVALMAPPCDFETNGILHRNILMSNTDAAPDIRDADAPGACDDAAAVLRRGGLVAFPTETVYGLGADATQPEAVARIFEAKGRPRFNPLIAHLPDLAAAARHAVFDSRAHALAEAFWPGPLTLVLPRAVGCEVARLASAGLDSLALRVPAHPVAHALLRAVGRPVVAPSANASGRISPTTAAHVAESLNGAVDMILDGGACAVGVESTILDLTRDPAVLLRPGGIARADIEAVIGALGTGGPTTATAESRPTAPGQLSSHYAPARPVRLNATEVAANEALLAFGPDAPQGAARTVNLSPRGDLREAAARLFAALHDLDRAGIGGIAAMPIPETGLGAAINDRLRRAAAPRDS